MGEATLAVTFIEGRTSIVTPPTDYPFDLAYVRDLHLRSANGSVEDQYIERLMAASVMHGEHFTQRAWMPQTRSLTLPYFPDVIEIPYPPLISVSSVEYVDGDGTTQTLDTTEYQVHAPYGPYAQPGTVKMLGGASWPSTDANRYDAVTITFSCGYQDLESPPNPDVPAALVHGALVVIGELYKVRSASVHTINQNPALVAHEALWRPFQVLNFLHRYSYVTPVSLSSIPT